MKDQIKLGMDRRKFVGSLGLIGTLSAINPFSLFAGKKIPISSGASIRKCKPYLQAATTDSVIVRWITEMPAHSWVEYGEEADNLHLIAKQVEDGMVQVDNTLQAIELQGLKPGKTYYFRVVSEIVKSLKRKEIAFGERIASEVFSFNTMSQDTDEVEFVIFNDVHERPETFAHLLQFSDKSKRNFVVLNGDMFNSLRDEDQLITNLLDPLSNSFESPIPFYFVRGNHETHGGYSRKITDYFDGKEHPFYYSLQYGPLWGIILDSGETKSDEDPVNGGIVDFDAYRIAQGKWLEQEVQKEEFKKAKFRVVFVHIPPNDYCAKENHAPAQYEKIWGPILNEAKVDLMICGHTHRHGIHAAVPKKRSYPVVIGGGKKDGTRTIISIKVDQESLKLRMIDDTGSLVGNLDLSSLS